MRPLNFFAFAFIVLSISSLAQDNKPNSIGVNLMLIPLKVEPYTISFPYVEYTRFLNDHAALSARLTYLIAKEEDESFGYSYKEDNRGPGVGFSFRWHFGKSMNGFFLGVGSDLMTQKWKTEETGGIRDSGNAIVFAPNLQLGGRFNLGPDFFIAPGLLIGFYASANSAGGSAAGVFGVPSIVLGMKF